MGNPRVRSRENGAAACARIFVSDKSSRATSVLAQCRTNLPSRTHDITTPAWRPVIYHPAANLYYVWRTVETVENTRCTLRSHSEDMWPAFFALCIYIPICMYILHSTLAPYTIIYSHMCARVCVYVTYWNAVILRGNNIYFLIFLIFNFQCLWFGTKCFCTYFKIIFQFVIFQFYWSMGHCIYWWKNFFNLLHELFVHIYI